MVVAAKLGSERLPEGFRVGKKVTLATWGYCSGRTSLGHGKGGVQQFWSRRGG
jgi:hypothetical protein